LSEHYTGTKELCVPAELIDELYKKGKIEIPDRRYALYPNMFVTLKCGESQSAITRVKDTDLHLVKTQVAYGVRARNQEQIMALDVLMDPAVPIVVLTGRAGTGKTLLTLAAGMQALQDGLHKKMILTRPMSQVGRHELGILPGTVEEKFGPYLSNYVNNIEQITQCDDIATLLERHPIDIIPFQLIRGASWVNTFVIADEVQGLNYHEMVTLGTRIGENSKIIVMGDMRQIDERISAEKTGIYKFVNDALSKASPLVAVVELVRCERSKIAALFADIFET
jgi:PhoH-like ATPase